MGAADNIQPPGNKLKKALKWLSDTSQKEPARKRADILREAEIRFDLSPAECEFLDSNFG